MSPIDHMPDFGSPLIAGESVLFPPLGAGSFSVVPHALRLAVDADGRPLLSLQIVKRSDDLSADGQYAVLDVQLTGDYALDRALAAARSNRADATVSPAPIDLGYARLIPAGPDIRLPDELTSPQSLGWSCADGARWTRRLDQSSGELIKGAMKNGTALFAALVEFTIVGVAARVPVQVTFEPAKLLDLALAGAGDRTLDSQALRSFLMRPLASLPLTIIGDADPARLADVLFDRLFSAYGTLAPAPTPRDQSQIRFTVPPGGAVMWDLDQPAIVPRVFALQFDMLAGLRQIPDPSALVRETVIPPLDLGFRTIDIAANLPKNRIGAPAIGARVDITPRPPQRPSGVTETLVFNAPDDEANLSVRLSPDETLRYSLTCFAVVAAGANVQQYEAAPVTYTAGWLQLQANDFPVLFAHITVSERLLALASINGALTYKRAGRQINQTIKLTKDMPDVAVAIPRDADEADLTFAAAALDGAKTLTISAPVPGRVELDLASFAEYGPHRVPIACDFGHSGGMRTVDLLGEDGANPATITLVPSAPTATWGYVAQSPFHSGYRFREDSGTWSDVIPAATPLHLTAS